MEPGCYFIDALLAPAMENSATSKFFNHEIIGRFKSFGGVRIESDVVVYFLNPSSTYKSIHQSIYTRIWEQVCMYVYVHVLLHLTSILQNDAFNISA